MIKNLPIRKSTIPYFYYIVIVTGITLSCFSTISSAKAQIAADNTLPIPSQVSPGKTQGRNFLINGGTTVGNNLFHSFKEFSVPTNGSAIFQNNRNLANIINRVTGGWESKIDGLIKTQGSANFFLINPNGIIFGANASLNIGGSFLASTASSIKLDNEGKFSATNPQSSLLTIGVPLGLQFGHKAGAIVNQSRAGLQGRTNTTLALVGGEVKGKGGNITVPDGQIELGSVEKNSFVRLTPNTQRFALVYADDQKFQDIQLDRSLLDVTGFSGGGYIKLQGGTVTLNQSRLFARTSPFGTETSTGITLRGNQLNINDSLVQTVTFGSVKGGDVTLEAKKVNVQGPWTTVAAETRSTGNGGKLTIRGDDVQLNNLSLLGTESSGSGNAGDVLIEAKKLSISNGAQVAIAALAEGYGGKLEVKASESIDLVGDGELFGVSETVPVERRFASGLLTNTKGAGNAAEISLTTGKLSIRDGAEISASTFANGDAGKVNIQATEVDLIGTAINGKPSGVSSEVESTATGQGGNITFATEKLRIRDGAQVSVSTFGIGNAGRVSVIAPHSIEVRGETSNSTFTGFFAQVEGKPGNQAATGQGGNIFLDTGKLILQGANARVSATSADAGSGGNVNIKTKDLLVQDGAQIQAATRGFAGAGKVEVTADAIQLIGTNVTPSALVTSTQGDAPAGNLTVNTKNLFIEDGGRISASTSGIGAGGELNINATEIKLIGTSATGEFTSGLFTETQGLGDAGELNIKTDKLLLTNGARVSADTFGGLGGSIHLIANSLEVSNGGQFRTNTASNSNAGNITMQVRDSILLTGTDSGIFASTTADSRGNGGKIDIDPISFIIRHGATIAVDSQGRGTGGDIKLVADSLTLDGGKISAETRSNTGGNINLQLQDLLLLRNSSQISTSAGNQQFGGDGGNITISSPFIVAPPIENSDITANAFTGRGGNIQITTDSILGISFSSDLTNLSNITASSTFGVSGVVEINSPEVDPSQGLPELPENTTDASKLIARGCSASPGQVGSRFMVQGKGGLAPSPEDIFSGDRILQDLETTPITTQQNLAKTAISPTNISRPPHVLVEAQAMVVNARGEIVLTAQAPKLKSRSSWLPTTNCHGS